MPSVMKREEELVGPAGGHVRCTEPQHFCGFRHSTIPIV